ncbi:hypothetical protein FACS189479_03320 [Spirochaetia bacterium]|nr:hypothetical protein FACS189479_03320 [Spirochaetia bacterium]
MAIIKPVYGDIRKAWPKEDTNFTPWLADEGLEILSHEIGIKLKKLGTEEPVGKYFLDILAEDEDTGEKVIIENKYGETDHDHIGKLLTYAAGFDAKTLILIAEKFSSEHRAALDFLNANSEIKIFGLEIKVKVVNDNDFIPEFDVVSSPNDWTETMKENERKKGRGWGRSNQNPWISVEEHRKGAGQPEIFDDIRNNILSFQDVKEESRSRAIYYKINGNKFASIVSTKTSGIYLGLNIDIESIEMPTFGRDLSKIGKLDAGDLRLQIHDEQEYEESKKYIKMAYEENK